MASSITNKVRKTEQIGVRVTREEKHEFERAARREGATSSEWLRRLAHAELKRQKAAA